MTNGFPGICVSINGQAPVSIYPSITVPPGTNLTWIGDHPFALAFHGTSPGRKVKLHSRREGTQHIAADTMRTDARPGVYPYAAVHVETDKLTNEPVIVLDTNSPVIIIEE